MAESGEENTLKIVHVIFRHGKRTNIPGASYPTNPHNVEKYIPYGHGQLTNEGKRQAYNLGKYLRKKYDTLLEDVYVPGIVDAMSSYTDRTKTTLQLVLAGLFPPEGEQIWDENLLWQPIPYHVLPPNIDKIFFGLGNQVAKDALEAHKQLSKYQEEIEKHKELFDYLSTHTGEEVKTIARVFSLYMCLLVEEECGLELPGWTKKVYPQPMKEIGEKFYHTLNETDTLKKFASGYLFNKILFDTEKVLTVKDDSQKTRICLYSGHDLTVASILIGLGLFTSHIPPYCSHIAIEVHTIDGVDGVKIFYNDHTSSEPKLLRLPNCNEFCPLALFRETVGHYLPVDDVDEKERLRWAVEMAKI